MINEFFETLCKSIITQFKLPRKGILMFLLLFSSLIIGINKCIFHYTLAPKGSLLLQLIYFLWFYSIFAMFAKAYNEYCDKKDAQKLEEEKRKKVQEEVNEYLEAINYFTEEEKNILIRFYQNNLTTYIASGSEITILIGLRKKGVDYITYHGSEIMGGTIVTNITGLSIINKYFDKQKPEFFELLDSLEEKELKLLKDFINNDETQVNLYKKEIKTAKSIITKFENSGFDDIYLYPEDCFNISNLYFAYLTKYFE